MKNVKVLRQFFLKTSLVFVSLCVVIGFSAVNAAPFGEVISFWDDRENSSTKKIDHSAWQNILNDNLDDETVDGVNRFNYDQISTGDESRLNAYIEYLQTIEPRQLSAKEQMAYWINLYNATTVLIVLDQGPGLSSIRQIRSGLFTRGPWQIKLLKVVQQELSLDDIEHGILRPIWRDKRIHYAVNCASIGCPNLLKTAFTAENLETLLEQAATDYINHSRGVDVQNGDATLSSIFDWYAEDFGVDFNALKQHLLEYADPQLAAQLENVTDADYDYDWNLNGVK